MHEHHRLITLPWAVTFPEHQSSHCELEFLSYARNTTANASLFVEEHPLLCKKTSSHGIHLSFSVYVSHKVPKAQMKNFVVTFRGPGATNDSKRVSRTLERFPLICFLVVASVDASWRSLYGLTGRKVRVLRYCIIPL